MKKFLLFLLKATLAICLPFIVLIRGSIFLHLYFDLNPWVALLAATFVTASILLFYSRLIFKNWLGIKKMPGKFYKFQIVLMVCLVSFYSAYGLVSFSKTNAKTERQQNEYSDLHPHLRIALSTVIFLDMKLVVTDMGRQKLDYRLMGLTPKERSMHYKQNSGYIHAVDLRTNNRSELRNLLLRGYFAFMGFHTLRHTGTADHLHISVPLRGNPRAI